MWAGIPDQFLSSYIVSYFGLSTIFCFSGFAENALDMNCKKLRSGARKVFAIEGSIVGGGRLQALGIVVRGSSAQSATLP